MSETIKDNKMDQNNQEHLSLDDGRRVKVLSPGMMVFKRFIRNRLAIVGICILVFMFLFSFLGGVISPYRQDQVFYKSIPPTRNMPVPWSTRITGLPLLTAVRFPPWFGRLSTAK